jgi:hypothetical protein
MKHAVFSFFAGQVLKTKWQSLCDSFWKEHVKITKRSPREGTSDKHSSQWKYCQQLSVLADVFTPGNVKSNIPPPDVDTIVVDVNEDMYDNVEEMSTEPMPESEDMITAANHSFPANTSRNSETRRKRKAEKARHFLSCLHWKKEN